MAYSVGDDREVALYLSFLECRTFILERREDFEFIGDNILPARSALELLAPDFARTHGAAAAQELQAALAAFDEFVRQHPQEFDAFFLYDHARVNRATDLENWIWDDAGHTPEIPADHWWWSPISTSTSTTTAQEA